MTGTAQPLRLLACCSPSHRQHAHGWALALTSELGGKRDCSGARPEDDGTAEKGLDTLLRRHGLRPARIVAV